MSESHLAEIEAKLHVPALRYSRATPEKLAAARCLIIDSYGLLSSIYRYATVAYVGGGFGVGIHNVPEAAVYGIPVIIGPNNHKFREARALIRLGGCIEVKTQEQFDEALTRLLTDTEALARASRASADYIAANSGASDIVFNATAK